MKYGEVLPLKEHKDYNLSLRLKREARHSATFRGHNLGNWVNDVYFYNIKEQIRSMAICKCCGMEVHINTRPLPNDIDVGGEAVALTCIGELRCY